MAFVDLPQEVHTSHGREFSPDLRQQSFRRVLLNCRQISVIQDPADSERIAVLSHQISRVVEDAGFEIPEVLFSRQGSNVPMKVIISHDTGIIALTESKERTRSVDVVITYRAPTAYHATRCCELLRLYFEGEATLP